MSLATIIAAIVRLWPVAVAIGAMLLVVAIIRDQCQQDRERGDGSDSSRRT